MKKLLFLLILFLCLFSVFVCLNFPKTYCQEASQISTDPSPNMPRGSNLDSAQVGRGHNFYCTNVSFQKSEIRSNGATEWARTYGGEGIELGRYIITTSDGGFLMVGYTDSLGNETAADDVWIVKLDSSGNIEWQRTYGEVRAYSVQETSDGGFIIAAVYIQWNDVRVTDDFWIIKLDSGGNIEWQQTHGGKHPDGMPGGEQAHSV
ncbi:hypothetical protein KA005_81245, partial [bacterium]|nr:hypothetical protein [bacterium]